MSACLSVYLSVSIPLAGGNQLPISQFTTVNTNIYNFFCKFHTWQLLNIAVIKKTNYAFTFSNKIIIYISVNTTLDGDGDESWKWYFSIYWTDSVSILQWPSVFCCRVLCHFMQLCCLLIWRKRREREKTVYLYVFFVLLAI